VLSHLACTDQPDHAMNRRQLESFQALRALFPQSESSLANSGGIFLGGDFLCDLTRCGIALYGGRPVSGKPNPMRPVVTAEARVAQVRRIAAGEAVSYGATEVTRDTIIAVCSVGYADGYPRSASGAGVPLRQAPGAHSGAAGFIHGRRVPVLGRITMDLTLFDVTDLGPDAVAVGDHIELFGPNMPIDEVAEAAGTISYELLTSLGRRYHREYVGGEVCVSRPSSSCSACPVPLASGTCRMGGTSGLSADGKAAFPVRLPELRNGACALGRQVRRLRRVEHACRGRHRRRYRRRTAIAAQGAPRPTCGADDTVRR